MAYRSSTVVQNTSGTSPHGDKPAGLAVGDYMLAAMNFDGTTSITPPSGWTSRNTGFQAAPDGQTTAVYDKIADSSDVAGTNWTWTFGAASDPIIIVGAWSGRNTNAPRTFLTDTPNTSSNTTAISCGGASGTAVTGDDLIYVCGLDMTVSGATWSFTPPASFTERQDSVNGVFNCLTLATQDNVSSGAKGTITATATRTAGSGNAGFHVIVASIAAAVPAVLSAATPSGTLGTATTATLGATTDTNSGTFYGVVDTAGNISGISAAQVKAGQNNVGGAAVASGNAAISTTSPSVGMTGLTAGTLYSYAVVQNSTGGDSNVLTGTFTTASAASNPSVRDFGPKGPLLTLITL